MLFGEFPPFNIDDITGFNNDNLCGGSFDSSGPDWGLSSDAGPSQPYTGVDVYGDLNNYPELDFLTPATAPTSLFPTHGVFSNKGHPSFYPNAILPQPAPTPLRCTTASPVPTLSQGSRSLSPELHVAPLAPPYQSYARSRAPPKPNDLGLDFLTAGGSCPLLTVHHSPAGNPSCEELWRQHPLSNPFHLHVLPPKPVTGVTLPEIPLPAPTASSSGPKRTRKSTRETRKYDPTKRAKKGDLMRDDWDQTLVRFQTELGHTLYNSRNGQLSGGLEPVMALAEINKIVKDDLKQSPLRNTKAGEGKRSRDVEDYLKGLLKSIHRVDPTPIPAGAESDESDTTVAALSRLANELEVKLVAVNQQPTLRRSTNAPERGQRMDGGQVGKQIKKNGFEKGRRDRERHHLERISRLFRAPQQDWTKKDLLSLAVTFLLYGSGAFSHSFVEVRPHCVGTVNRL